jgi:hypothetical protein
MRYEEEDTCMSYESLRRSTVTLQAYCPWSAQPRDAAGVNAPELCADLRLCFDIAGQALCALLLND